MNSYIRIAAIVPELKIGDVEFNTKEIISAMQKAKSEGAEIVLFPELCITGYTCADLFYQSKLRREAVNALIEIVKASGLIGITAVIGLPVEVNSKLYNCAALTPILVVRCSVRMLRVMFRSRLDVMAVSISRRVVRRRICSSLC